MISDIERARPNNGMMMNRNRNYNKITVGNMSGRTPYQCGVSTAIEG